MTPTLFDRLPMATEYRVEIPAGTVSETGGELADDGDLGVQHAAGAGRVIRAGG